MRPTSQSVTKLGRLIRQVAAILSVAVLSGCAAWSFPVTGLPANRVPAELLAVPKEGSVTVDLALLGQRAPDVYRLGPGDILGVWIENVLGAPNELPPIQLSANPDQRPALGYPVHVRDDGTIALPQIAPLRVEGLSLNEVEEQIREAYTKTKQIIREGRERVMVTLIRPRTYHVLVIRQETGTPFATSAGLALNSTKQGAGQALDLPAYENDVLNAISLTGGLPGLDAINEIIIQRGVFQRATDRESLQNQGLKSDQPPPGAKTVRIPLRMRPGEQPSFSPEDVILHTGDVVFIESRLEFYYTGGLLGSGEYPLPRDYDLDVLEAVAQVNGPIANGGFAESNLSGSIIAGGIGDTTPSKLIVLRKMANGKSFPIYVDLNRALVDPSHRILVMPGDFLVLQQTRGEASIRYLSQVLNLNVFWQIWSRGDSSGSATSSFPNGFQNVVVPITR